MPRSSRTPALPAALQHVNLNAAGMTLTPPPTSLLSHPTVTPSTSVSSPPSPLICTNSPIGWNTVTWRRS